MLRLSALIAPVTAGLLLLPTLGSASDTTAPLGLIWHDCSTLPIEGKGWADSHTHYHRLPSRAKGQVPDMVWRLASNTSGLTLRFVTDSTTIAAQWDGGTPMNHMAATGSHGLDLYTRPWSEDGTTGGPWKYAGTGRPNTTATTALITRNRPAKLAEYLLYLPTYAPVTTLTLGLDPGARLLPGRPRDPARKPIVFYGTSITQAGCASRSGMGHTSILGRWLDREVINLGFSGSGKTEPAIIQLIAELDPALFVLEPLPNMTTEMVKERMGIAVQLIREKHPKTPILLVANPVNLDDHAQNRALRMEFDRLRKRGDKNLHYLPSAGQLDGREEGTVDGTHPTDLGFERMATAYEPVLRRILREK